ncbi:MAG: hypothetical protein RQ783_09685 [Gammaproteobacteria bacterium]|nr:hypothetical protein [Gammaproteobacteria bacterium]
MPLQGTFTTYIEAHLNDEFISPDVTIEYDYVDDDINVLKIEVQFAEGLFAIVDERSHERVIALCSERLRRHIDKQIESLKEDQLNEKAYDAYLAKVCGY